jgi:probable HAF family extracellular repeat protein
MAQAISYNYATLDDPFATNGLNGTYAFDINDGGTVVGYYYAGGGAHGFVESGGSYVNLDYPGANIQTFPEAINKEGQIVGWYNDLSNDHGFLYSNGSFTALNDPLSGGGNTWARGINDQGHIVGYFQNFAPSGLLTDHGFVYENGIYTTLDDPLASTTANSNGTEGTVASGINNHDQIVGYYYDSNDRANGFLYSNGKYTTLDDPLGVDGTFATGINDKGQIVGYYQDLNGTHGFVYSGGTYTNVEDPLGGSNALGINNKGQIVGYYGGADRLAHGFVATPAGAHSLATSSVQAAPSFGSTSPSATGSVKFDEASWMLSPDGDTRTLVKDLPVRGSLTPDTTLAYWMNGTVHTLDTSNQVTQLVQAMAGFAASSGPGDSLNTVAHSADTSQQSFLTIPHQHT